MTLPEDDDMLDLTTAHWSDHPQNPLIEPPAPSWLIADPTVLGPDHTPDRQWHMWANSVGFIHHYVSVDGFSWHAHGGKLFGGIRPFVFHLPEENSWYLLYEKFSSPFRSGIAMRMSSDLFSWSEPTLLLRAQSPRDGRGFSFLGNPCLVKTSSGEFRLYHSYHRIFLTDCLYFEPRFVGLAVSHTIDGPYQREPRHLLGPEPEHPLRNRGAGSIKVFADDAGGWWALQNGIYKDVQGRHRSAIVLLRSSDGYNFEQQKAEPVVAPQPGWKRAFVYAFDPVWHEDELRLYYNARDGWLRGKERIGLCIARSANDKR